jgi:hypothetical protein
MLFGTSTGFVFLFLGMLNGYADLLDCHAHVRGGRGGGAAKIAAFPVRWRFWDAPILLGNVHILEL